MSSATSSSASLERSLGGFLFSHMGFAGSGGLFYSIFVAFLGAVILSWLFRLVTGNRT